MSTNLPPNEQPKGNGLQPSTNALVGLAILAIGGFFLLKNFGVINWDFEFNWWALFLLIPVGSILQNVWQQYRRNGDKLTRELRTKLVAGAGILLVALMLLIGLDWDRYWPVFLILGGVALLLNVLGSSDRRV